MAAEPKQFWIRSQSRFLVRNFGPGLGPSSELSILVLALVPVPSLGFWLRFQSQSWSWSWYCSWYWSQSQIWCFTQPLWSSGAFKQYEIHIFDFWSVLIFFVGLHNIHNCSALINITFFSCMFEKKKVTDQNELKLNPNSERIWFGPGSDLCS